MNIRSRAVLQFLALFGIFSAVIFAYLHLDFYPVTSLTPMPLKSSLLIGVLGGLGVAVYATRNRR